MSTGVPANGGGGPMGGEQQAPDFFLQYYRLGKTLGIGSFGKVGGQASSSGPLAMWGGCVV